MKNTMSSIFCALVIAALLTGCDDAGIRVFSDKTETKILQVIYQDGTPLIDEDGDGTYEPTTEAQIEALQAEGWQVRVFGGPSQ